MYSIGGDIVDIKDGDILSIGNYPIIVEDGKWNASVPAGNYTFSIQSTVDGTLSPLSQKEFLVGEDNTSIKNILVIHPVEPNPTDRKTIKVGKTEDCNYSTINNALDAIKAMGDENFPKSEDDRITIVLNGGELFREQVRLTIPYITIKSSSNTLATISWYYAEHHKFYSVGDDGYYSKDYTVAKIGKISGVTWSSTFRAEEEATNFIAENIRFENSTNLYYTKEEN